MATKPQPAAEPAPEQPPIDNAFVEAGASPFEEPVAVGELREGWRTPMDNPLHPLHHLRNT